MGAIHFSIDAKLLETIIHKNRFDAFVETGTYKGDSVDGIRHLFPEIHTIELSKEYYQSAKSRFDKHSNIHLYLGDSSVVIKDVVKKIGGKSICFWLDAHWCADENTGGKDSQCPLLKELRGIGTLNDRSLIMIDDARMFLSPPLAPHEISQWPELDDIIFELKRLSSGHKLMVIDDVLIFFPERIHQDLKKYSHNHGADWLNLAVKGREHDNLLVEVRSKDAEIQSKDNEIQSKDAVIQQQDRDLQAKDADLIRKEVALQTSIGQLNARVSEVKAYKTISEDRQSMIDRLEIARKEIHDRYENELKLLNTIAEEKERSIGHLQHILNEREVLINDQKRSIDELRQALDAGMIRRLVNKIRHLVARLLSVKLGVLYHHPPKPIELPARYLKKLKVEHTPKISIVTPSFNQGAYIEKTIRSVFDQAYPEVEYIVQDGGSNDNTVDILKKYENRLSYWESKPDNGQAHALNEGFKRTTGEIMHYINSDDFLLPGAVHYAVNYFNKHPEIDVVYGHRILVDENGGEVGRWVMPPHDNKVLSWADYLPQETLFWRREIWDKAGGNIDTTFRFAMDWDLILRFREAGATFKRLPRFLAAFRVHPQQKSIGTIAEVGIPEMQALRKRCLGREVHDYEINHHIKRYLLKHTLYHKLYRLGLLRY